MRRHPWAPALALLTLAAGCSPSGGDPTAASTTSSAPGSSPSTTTTTTTIGPPPEAGVFEVGADGVELLDGPGGSVTGRIRSGVLLPYDEQRDGHARVMTPCDNEAWVALDRGTARGPFQVVIDPGHGGEEPGATGPTGLTEAEVNLDIGQRAVAGLRAEGVSAVATRTGDYRATLAFRVRLAIDAGAEVFVSIHHNAEPDEERPTPGTETYYQYASDDSKRLTGLIQEEVFRAFSRYEITFAADTDAGAKYRLSDEGRDYYGVIRRSFEADVVATLAESAFISNPQEEALLRRDDVRQAEADAIVQGILRYFAGEQPGDVFTVPYPRTAPAGGGGGRQGCEDPG